MYNSIDMSDPVQLALIAAGVSFVGSLPATLAAISNMLMTIRNHRENRDKLQKISEQTNGVVDKLVNATSAASKAEGKVEGRAEEKAEKAVRAEALLNAGSSGKPSNSDSGPSTKGYGHGGAA